MTRFMRNYIGLILFAALQAGFWGMTRGKLPDMGIVPDVPGQVAVQALSFGDEEFYFRLLALDLQNAGDTFGRFTALYRYDYKKLYAWFTLLDVLNNESDYVPFLASYYYSQTQHTADVRYVVDYLYEHSWQRPEKKYWWLAQATYLAEHRLGDNDLALKMAAPLEHADSAPFWVRQLPAFVHEKRGEMDDAMEIIQHILAEAKDHKIPDSEFRFMEYFIKERLHKAGVLDDKETH